MNGICFQNKNVILIFVLIAFSSIKNIVNGKHSKTGIILHMPTVQRASCSFADSAYWIIWRLGRVNHFSISSCSVPMKVCKVGYVVVHISPSFLVPINPLGARCISLRFLYLFTSISTWLILILVCSSISGVRRLSTGITSNGDYKLKQNIF